MYSTYNWQPTFVWMPIILTINKFIYNKPTLNHPCAGENPSMVEVIVKQERWHLATRAECLVCDGFSKGIPLSWTKIFNWDDVRHSPLSYHAPFLRNTFRVVNCVEDLGFPLTKYAAEALQNNHWIVHCLSKLPRGPSCQVRTSFCAPTGRFALWKSLSQSF